MRTLAVVATMVLFGCGSDPGSTAPLVDGGGSTGHDDGAPPPVDGGGPIRSGPIAQLTAGRYHTCALLGTGEIYCWGQGAYRQLGGDYGAQHVARRVETVADALAIDAGDRFTCAIRPGGAVWCWGDDDHGQAGTALAEPCGDSMIDSVCVTTPQPVAGLASGVAELALGAEHACARRDDGSIACWGDNSSGQVGAPALADVPDPTVVAGVGGVTRLVAGDQHTCALVGSPGTVSCWGANGNGQLGNGSTADAVPTPGAVGGLSDAIDVVAGGEHTCAIRAGGAVACWGYNYLGQLGNGSTRPTRATSLESVVGLADATHLAAGRYHTCALRAGGAVVCWGNNQKGELGDGTTTDRTSPVAVSGLDAATLLTAGAWHTCGATSAGGVWCWGDDLGAQLGDDRVTSDATPTPVMARGLP